jgi:hypothetical protein
MVTKPIKRLTERELRDQIPAARARETRDRRAGLRARSAAYDHARERLVLELTNGVQFAFPVSRIRELRGVAPNILRTVGLDPAGDLVMWPDLDVDLSVPGLIAASFPRSTAARQLGRKGGSATSDAKADAARANGAKGGRPRRSA